MLLIPLIAYSQKASDVAFVNAGKMYVANQGTASIYILGGVRMIDGVSAINIKQDGTTKLTGNFYQDSQGHVFDVDASGYGTSKGRICFFDPTGGSDLSEKFITSRNVATFDRPANYVAFPAVKIDMDKNLIMPARMSADMDTVIAQKSGKLWLKSATSGTGSSQKVYDASLRFPKRTTSETDNSTGQVQKAPLGKVIVERDIVPYRGNTTATGVMFPFATPFAGTQRSGYFAGNWVRRPVADASGHTALPYGDKIDTSKPGNVINRDQYVTDPVENLVAGQGYLIKPLGTSEFDNLPINFPENGLQITGAGAPAVSDYKKTLFVFDGTVYKLAKTAEQLNLVPAYNKSVTGSSSKTVNVLIGNSYTSAIDLEKLSNYMINHALTFNRYIYVYLPHSATYVAYDAYQHAPGQPTGASVFPERTIPAMGVFMLRLAKKNATGTITIDRTLLTHGNNAHNLRSDNGFNNEVLFTLTSETNPNIYDLSAIGIRETAKETFETLDMPKFIGEVVETPVLYSLSSDNEKLMSNSIPEDVKSVKLCVESGFETAEKCTLQVSRQESMHSEYLILEDKVMHRFIDLYNQDNYSFILNPQDAKDRFVVHFTQQEGMGEEYTNMAPLKLFYNRQSHNLEVIGLTDNDLNSKITIADTQGRVLMQRPVAESVAVDHFPEGIYIARITGERTVLLKFAR